MRTLSLALLACLVLAACGGDAATVAHAGTYKLDKDSLINMALDSMKEQMGVEEIPAEQVEMVKGMLGKATVNMELKADGTWQVTGAMGGDALNDSGTYTVDGKSITFVTTMKDGKEANETKTGTIEDGVIMVKPDDEAPGEIRLVRE